jgi:hypothetical protein
MLSFLALGSGRSTLRERSLPRDHRQLRLERGFVLIGAEGAGRLNETLRLFLVA